MNIFVWGWLLLLSLFYLFTFWSQGMWDLTSPIGGWTCALCSGSAVLITGPPWQADSLLSETPQKPRILEWVAYPFSRGSSRPRNWGLLHCWQILYQLSYQGRVRWEEVKVPETEVTALARPSLNDSKHGKHAENDFSASCCFLKKSRLF